MSLSFNPARYYVAALAMSMSPVLRDRFVNAIHNRPATYLEAQKVADAVHRRAAAQTRGAL